MMADTKQATPLCPRCNKLLQKVRQESESMLNHDQWDSVKAGDWFCECHNNGRGHAPYAYFWNSELAASRSGPDRTPAVQHSIDKYRPALEALARDDEAGPDRGQQDAPDELREALRQALELVWEHHNIGFIRRAHEQVGGSCELCKESRLLNLGKVLEKFGAKAAREGQAPKGDRIKVEREPGCKCEYAIWTNAKGCPLHDVQGKSSDSEKQG